MSVMRGVGKRLWVVFFAALLLGGSLGFGGGFRVGWVEALTANGTWSGSWLTEVWGNFTSGLYVEDLTAGRPVISLAGGRLGTDAGLLWDAATNTLTVSNRTNTGQISISGLTPGRIPYVTTGNLLADAAGLLYNTITGTFTAPNIVTPGDANATDVHASNLYANTALIDGYYPGSSPSFTIWNNTLIYARNESTGDITNSTNAATLIQSVFTALTSGQSVFFKEGIYTIATQVTLTVSNVRIDFGKATFDNQVAGDYMFYFYGTVGADTILTGNVLQGAVNIPVTDATIVSIGDYILIYDDVVESGRSNKNGEINQITNIVGNTITVADPIKTGYAVVQNAAIQKLNTLNNIDISGGIFQSSNTGLYQLGLRFNALSNGEIDALTINDIISRAIRIENSIGIKINRLIATRINLAGTGYGVSFVWANRHMSVVNSIFTDCRHGVTSGTAANGVGYLCDSIIEVNNFIKSSIDAHEGTGVDCKYINNIVEAEGISLGGKRWEASGNTLINSIIGIGDRGNYVEDVTAKNNNFIKNNQAIMLDSSALIHAEIIGANIYNVVYNGIDVNGNANLVVNINNIYVDGNTAVGYHLIDVVTAKWLQITGCTIFSAQWCGIKATSISEGDISHNNVYNNAVANDGTSGAKCTGIYILTSTYISVNNNHAYNIAPSTQHYGIIFDASTSCTAEANIMYGNTVKQMIATTGTILSRNLGYLTENTLTVTNTTATTFLFNHGLAGDIDAVGDHGGVWFSFDPTTEAALTGKPTWISDATQVLVTVSGVGLPATMTMRIYMVYKP